MNFDDELPPDRPFAELFRDLLAGVLEAESPEAQRFFREYPGLDKLWAEHGETAKLLDASGRVERETLLEIVRSVPAPGEARVASIVASLRPRPEEAPPRPFPRPPLWFWVVVGVGALALLVQLLRGKSYKPELGILDRLFETGNIAQTPELVAPLGQFNPRALERFSWRLDSEGIEGRHFLVVVLDLVDEELVRSIHLRPLQTQAEYEWRPLSGAISRMVEEGGVYWRVELWEGDERLATSQLGEVRFE